MIMPRKLPSDCLTEIFKHLSDKTILNSCLLVNRFWCEVSVQILWKIIRNYNTLIASLPNESKETLLKSGIIISTSTLKPPLLNYIPFIKILSIHKVIENVQLMTSQDDVMMVMVKEVLGMITKQTSL